MINNTTSVIIGGGAAGFFTAVNGKRADNRVIILEGGPRLLTKVKVSGGGRCNVTHHLFDVKSLVNCYPRGSKELIGPFHRFQPQDTINWYKDRGVDLHVESDGRMFPTTNSSQTIIDCLRQNAEKAGVEIRKGHLVKGIEKQGTGFLIKLRNITTLL